jgi:hypothetical protein
MLDVICFYWCGYDRPNWHDKELGVQYINRLYAGVCRNLTLPFVFTCFLEKGINKNSINKKIDVKYFDSPSWRGCLPKLKAFDHNNGFSDRVIVLDLDLVITGNLDEMFSYNGTFMTRSTFKKLPKMMSGGDIVFFKAGTMPFWDVLTEKTEEIEELTGGRERFIYRKFFKKIGMDFVQVKYPNQIFSYKRHVLRANGKLSPNCRIVSCHGRPRPHEIKEPWIKEHWI